MSQRHIISQNIANGSAKIKDPDPNISLFNFHYAWPPVAVAENYPLNKPIGFNETGFAGSIDVTYRSQAWHFMLAGGALFNNLDYSFTVRSRTAQRRLRLPRPAEAVRRCGSKIAVLSAFLRGLSFERMSAAPDLVTRIDKPNLKPRCLASAGSQYAIYLEGTGIAELQLNAPKGNYRAQWIDTRTAPS